MNAGKKVFHQLSLFSSFIHCFTFYAVNCEYLRNANINILSVYGNRLLKCISLICPATSVVPLIFPCSVSMAGHIP